MMYLASKPTLEYCTNKNCYHNTFYFFFQIWGRQSSLRPLLLAQYSYLLIFFTGSKVLRSYFSMQIQVFKLSFNGVGLYNFRKEFLNLHYRKRLISVIHIDEPLFIVHKVLSNIHAHQKALKNPLFHGLGNFIVLEKSSIHTHLKCISYAPIM